MADARWPRVVRPQTDLVKNNPRVHTGRTPCLLSLDGGGMRGLITAQVLIELEDDIKQVLWKERLIIDVKPLLEDGAARGVFPAERISTFVAEYKLQESGFHDFLKIGDGHPLKKVGNKTDDDFVRLWSDYADWQKRLLDPPKDWDLIKQCFEVDIGDWFDQLAGTSTGGLLALYLAARGGCGDGLSSKDPRPGSAAGASFFYEQNGKEIFVDGTEEERKRAKFQNFLDTKGYAMHKKDGLERVLGRIFKDKTLHDLEEHGANVLVTTVDVSSMRTGAFFHQSAKLSPAQVASGTPAPDPQSYTSGLFTPLRKSDKGRSVLVRDPRIPDPVASAEGRQAMGWLQIMRNQGHAKPADGNSPAGGDCTKGKAPPTSPSELKFVSAIGGWVAPMHSELCNFKLVDVARATSAAPTFLPPMVVNPVGDCLPEDWDKDSHTFVDGGLGNNDPVYMGLAQMLQRNNNAGLQDCAVLSIGTGTKVAFDGYNTDDKKPDLGFWAGMAMKLGLGGLAARVLLKTPLKGVKDKGPLAAVNAAKALSGLVGLTMSINGEDKENILRSLFYGLLRTPEGTYMRLQIRDEANPCPAKFLSGVSKPGAKPAAEGGKPVVLAGGITVVDAPPQPMYAACMAAPALMKAPEPILVEAVQQDGPSEDASSSPEAEAAAAPVPEPQVEAAKATGAAGAGQQVVEVEAVSKPQALVMMAKTALLKPKPDAPQDTVPVERDPDAIEVDAKQLEEWREALGAMDDPSPKTLKAYKEMGQALAVHYSARLKWWVRCFIFGLEDAARYPLLMEVAADLDPVADRANQVAGGRYLAAALCRPDRAATSSCACCGSRVGRCKMLGTVNTAPEIADLGAAFANWVQQPTAV